ncbi:hypothetical protein TNCV_62511 [Trichonephila clavipes]|nr:hypothetical protein TNCV_62511 [Trichonephila clavipes]
MHQRATEESVQNVMFLSGKSRALRTEFANLAKCHLFEVRYAQSFQRSATLDFACTRVTFTPSELTDRTKTQVAYACLQASTET